jgi:D-glycero-beta-D-manno-heptose-7-phosphate kinase
MKMSVKSWLLCIRSSNSGVFRDGNCHLLLKFPNAAFALELNEGPLMKIAVIGDGCLDVFVYCRTDRLAPDLPIPVLEKMEERTNPGMALNVSENLLAIGVDVETYTNPDWRENTKTRMVDIASNHSFLRLDSLTAVEPLRELPDLSAFDAVVVSDYNKGFLTESVIERITSAHTRCFLDTKKPLGHWAKGAYLVKINDPEYLASKYFIDNEPEFASRVIRTMGSRGAEFLGVTFPVDAKEVKDSTGAGDSFMAALVFGVTKGMETSAAISFANRLASDVVTRRGISLVNLKSMGIG